LPDLEEMNQSIPNEKRRALHEEKIFFEGTEIVNPNKIVNAGDFFDLGEIRADLIFTPGHTSTNISVFLKKEKVLYNYYVAVCEHGQFCPKEKIVQIDFPGVRDSDNRQLSHRV